MIIETPSRHNYYYNERKHTYFLVPSMLASLIGHQPETSPSKISKANREYYQQKWEYWEKQGLLQEQMKDINLSRRLTREEIEFQLANLKQLTLEVTEKCNLKCAYCGYGSLYSNRDPRDRSCRLPLEWAIRLVDYLKQFWNSSLNQSHQKRIYISFYGGEPLLNFPFIKKMVAYIRSQSFSKYFFNFSMTSNGVLLDRYKDFLAEHDFDLILSLDGNERHHSYRVFQNGQPSFPRVFQNILGLQKKHPDYFERKVQFNAVLHNRSSVDEVFHYIKEQFGKDPNIIELNTSGIATDKKKEFWQMYANVQESLYQSEGYSQIQKELFIKLPNMKNIAIFLQTLCQMSFMDYNGVMIPGEDDLRSSTGTCLPFQKKMFVTAQGKILPCERIGHEHGLGQVTSEGVILDLDAIVDKYNQLWGRFDRLCSRCPRLSACKQCLFNLDLSRQPSHCHSFMNARDWARYIQSQLAFLEKNRHYYHRILTQVVIE